MKKLDYSLSNEDCERAVDEFLCDCYKSPIELVTADIQSSISKQLDNDIYRAVVATGVIVDKDELIRALKYDRDQYEKGYSDGYAEGMMAMKNKIEETDKKSSCTHPYKNVLYVTPDVYNKIKNNPNSIIINAQGEPYIELQVTAWGEQI